MEMNQGNILEWDFEWQSVWIAATLYASNAIASEKISQRNVGNKLNVYKYKYINNDEFESKTRTPVSFLRTRTQNRSVNYENPNACIKCEFSASYVSDIMKIQNNTDEKPQEREKEKLEPKKCRNE